MTFNKTFVQKNRSSSNNNLILRRNTTPLNSFYHCKMKIPYNVLLHCINIKFLRFHIFLLSSLKLLTKVKSSLIYELFLLCNKPSSEGRPKKLSTYFHTWYNNIENHMFDISLVILLFITYCDVFNYVLKTNGAWKKKNCSVG